MRIAVHLVVDVDPRVWAGSNGRLLDADGHYRIPELRDDVRSYVLTLTQGSALIDETEASVELRT